ncbi:MAG: hypothetical protein AAFU77_06465, partial [Myxococcota bacterium]
MTWRDPDSQDLTEITVSLSGNGTERTEAVAPGRERFVVQSLVPNTEYSISLPLLDYPGRRVARSARVRRSGDDRLSDASVERALSPTFSVQESPTKRSSHAVANRSRATRFAALRRVAG